MEVTKTGLGTGNCRHIYILIASGFILHTHCKVIHRGKTRITVVSYLCAYFHGLGSANLIPCSLSLFISCFRGSGRHRCDVCICGDCITGGNSRGGYMLHPQEEKDGELLIIVAKQTVNIHYRHRSAWVGFGV